MQSEVVNKQVGKHYHVGTTQGLFILKKDAI